MSVAYASIGAVQNWDFVDGSKSVAVPAHSVGDLLVAFIHSVDATSSPTITSGWSVLGETGDQPLSGGADTSRATVIYKVATSTSDTLSVTPHTGGVLTQAICAVLTGADPTTPFVSTEWGFTSNSSTTALQTHPTKTASTAGSGLLIFRACQVAANRTFTSSVTAGGGVERYDGSALEAWADMVLYTKDNVSGSQSFTTTASAGVQSNHLWTIIVNPAPTSTPKDLGTSTLASFSTVADATLKRRRAQHLTSTVTSLSDLPAATLTQAGHPVLAGTVASVSSTGSTLTTGVNHGWMLTSTSTSLTGLSGPMKVNRNHQIAGTSLSSSDGLLGQLSQGRNNPITSTVTSLSEGSADLHIKQPPPFAFYEFFIDWNRDNGLRVSDFETGFDGWEPADRLSLSTDYSFSGEGALKAVWMNATPTSNDPASFIFGSAPHGFDSGVFAVTSSDPVDDSVLSVTYSFSGLIPEQPYTFSVWVLVPSTGGQHITAGVRDLAVSDPTTKVDQWVEVRVPFTPTASEHTLFVDAYGTVVNGNATYIDYVFIEGEFENITERVRIDDVSWNYGRDQSRALNPVTPAETSIVVDNQDGLLSPNNYASPVADYLLPNRELLVRATFRNHIYDLLRVYLDDITEDPYVTEQRVEFSAVDPLASIAGGQLSTQVWMGVRTGDAINHILDEIGWPDNRRDIDPGATVISHFWVEGQDASDAITDLVASEGPPAYATVSDAGYFIFRDRHHRIVRPESSEVQATFNPTLIEPCFSPPAEINVGWKDIINSVTFTVNERSTIVTENEEGSKGEAPSVWKYEGTFSIPAGESRTFHVTAEVPVLFFQAPDIKKNDYIIAGGDVEFSLSRTTGSSTDLTIFAPANDVAITNLIVRGYPINTLDGITVTVQDEGSIDQVGEKADTDNVEAPWANANDAQAIGDIITRTRGRRLPTMTITLNNGTPERLLQIFKRRLSDLVHIIEPRSFTHHDFYIESIEHTISNGGKLHVTKFGCEMVPDIIEPSEESLTPFTFGDEYAGFDTGVFAYDTIQADPDDVFILDVSKLDEDGLGY